MKDYLCDEGGGGLKPNRVFFRPGHVDSEVDCSSPLDTSNNDGCCPRDRLLRPYLCGRKEEDEEE